MSSDPPFSSSSSGTMTELDRRLCLAAFSALTSKHLSKKNFLFLKPIDTTHFPTYLDVVKRPMDLGTLRDNLEAGRYASRSHFFDDAALCFENAVTFNDGKKDRRWVVKLARSMLRIVGRERAKADKIATGATKKKKKGVKSKKSSGGCGVGGDDNDNSSETKPLLKIESSAEGGRDDRCGVVKEEEFATTESSVASIAAPNETLRAANNDRVDEEHKEAPATQRAATAHQVSFTGNAGSGSPKKRQRRETDEYSMAEGGVENLRMPIKEEECTSDAKDVIPPSSIRLWLRGLDTGGREACRFEKYTPAFEREFDRLEHIALAADQSGDSNLTELLDACGVMKYGDKAVIKNAISNLPRSKK